MSLSFRDTSRELSKEKDSQKEKIDIKRIIDATQQGKEIINHEEKTNHFLVFWGFSGVAKSSSIIILNGQGVKAYFNGTNIIVEQKPIPQTQMGVRIQQQIVAGTKCPAFLKLEYHKGKEQVLMCDLPGLGDNRDPTQNLINSYFIHRIFDFYKKVKLIFTIKYEELLSANKARGFELTMKGMIAVLGPFNNYYRGVTILVTKVSLLADEAQVLTFFQAILTDIPMMSQNPTYKTFLQHIIRGQVPLILVKEPDVPSSYRVTKDAAINVTSQYSNVIKQTYQIVTEKLQTINDTFPSILNFMIQRQVNQLHLLFDVKSQTAIDQRQYQKYRPLIEQAQKDIKRYINYIKERLQRFIKQPFNNLELADDLNELKNRLMRMKNLSEFARKIHEISQSAIRNDQKNLKQNFQMLKKMFQNYNFQCETSRNNKIQCVPMTKLNDQYILIKFLLTLRLEKVKIKLNWKNESQIIRQLFLQIMALRLRELAGTLLQKLNSQVFDMLNYQFQEQFLNKIQDQYIYISWANHYKVLPSIFERATRLNRQIEPIQYFTRLNQDCKKTTISSSRTLDKIIAILKLKNQYVSKITPHQYIQKKIKPLMVSKCSQLVANITAQKQWTFEQTEEAIDYFYYPEKQSNNSNQLRNDTMNNINEKENQAYSLQTFQQRDYYLMERVYHLKRIQNLNAKIKSLNMKIQMMKQCSCLYCCCCCCNESNKVAQQEDPSNISANGY